MRVFDPSTLTCTVHGKKEMTRTHTRTQ